MDEYVKWRGGHFWQRILPSDKQASFIKIDGEPLRTSFTRTLMFAITDHPILDIDLMAADFGNQGAKTHEERERWLQWTIGIRYRSDPSPDRLRVHTASTETDCSDNHL